MYYLQEFKKKVNSSESNAFYIPETKREVAWI
jgi:hypothetical protein